MDPLYVLRDDDGVEMDRGSTHDVRCWEPALLLNGWSVWEIKGNWMVRCEVRFAHIIVYKRFWKETSIEVEIKSL